jgi:hypothetical protein
MALQQSAIRSGERNCAECIYIGREMNLIRRFRSSGTIESNFDFIFRFIPLAIAPIMKSGGDLHEGTLSCAVRFRCFPNPMIGTDISNGPRCVFGIYFSLFTNEAGGEILAVDAQ